MKKIKVIHVARFAKPHIGGVEAVIEQINDSLPDDEYEKEVICCSNTEKSSFENGVKYTRCPYLFDFAANSISPYLFFKMMFLKTDYIHFHMPVIQNVIIWFILYHLGLLRYKKMIVTYHGAIIGYDKYMKPFWGLYKYFLSKADKIHILVESNDKILDNQQNKFAIIPFGIDIAYSETKSTNFDIKEFANGRKILLCIGRLVPLKGFIYAIEAMKNVDDAVLLIAGGGDEQTNYENYIKENSLENKVKLIGYISEKAQKEYLFSNIDILIVPSVRTESFGIVQLEAMKYSKPIINTNLHTGMNFVSPDKITGLTVEPKNAADLAKAIQLLVNNDNLRFEYGHNGRKRVEELYNIEIIKDKYKMLYRK